MNISYSKVELFSQCGFKYYLRYVERYSVDQTFTPLLFGTAIDKALNYVLTRKKHKHTVDPTIAKALFEKYMKAWHGQNELVFFKNEAPKDIEQHDKSTHQQLVWDNLLNIGKLMITTYIDEILPTFTEIVSVQTRREIKNETGDTLVLITDFSAKLDDGRTVVLDNKTSSNINKYYGETCVVKSQQLAIYCEFEENRYAGYVALQKKLVRGKVKWNIVIDEVPEPQIESAFQKIDGALHDIKNEKFEKDKKNCFSFGRKCEYYNLCTFGDSTGLIKR